MIPLATQILQSAYSRLGIDFNVVELPGARATRLLGAGLLDGELFRGPNFSEILPTVVQVPVAIAQGELMVFTTRDDITINRWDDLSGYHGAALIRLKEVLPTVDGFELSFAKLPEDPFKLLVRGRVDLVISPRRIGDIEIAKLGRTDIRALEPALRQDKLYHYVHMKHQHLVGQLTQILNDMVASGEIEAITKQADNAAIEHIKSLQSTK
jgi:hypothetical protein